MKAKLGNNMRLICIMPLFGFSALVFSQGDLDSNPLLITDRPDATEASSVCRKGVYRSKQADFMNRSRKMT